ncbi:unnamed protein product [Fraxinus pennsylvanica]|uniref:Uncharacterized protein n=1 Tax=Fraxinus pennsylvanica TaxID=56036 RepID=A0AAD1YQH6_9LAMI|nr:unnamed protein product [Fraxinus pennsylvanica]
MNSRDIVLVSTATIFGAAASAIAFRRFFLSNCPNKHFSANGVVDGKKLSPQNPYDPIKRKENLSWDDYFMAIAFLSADRSKDPNRRHYWVMIDLFRWVAAILKIELFKGTTKCKRRTLLEVGDKLQRQNGEVTSRHTLVIVWLDKSQLLACSSVNGNACSMDYVDLKFQALGPTLVLKSGVVSKDTESGASRARESTNMSRDLPLETPWTSHLGTYFSRHKQTLYIQKHNDPSQKNLNEKSALIVTGEAPKDLTDVSVNNVTLMEVASSIRESGETIALKTPNIMAEPSTHQRRKSHRISKNKQRLDEAAVISPIPSVTREETNPAKEYIENGKSKASLSDLDSSVSAKIELDGGVQASEVQASHEEEAHSRVSKQWKPQSRGMPRSLQANRMVDKFHSNDTLMWAPVRSQSKVEGAVEACQKSTPESATPVKIDNLVQNNSEGKMAEMERYVPKPVAKELAQQGSIQPVPFSASPAPEEAAGKALSDSARSANPPPTISATGIVGSGVDVEEGDGTHNKQGKAHGTWRQRNFTEPSNKKSVHHGPSATSDPSKDIQRSTDQNQFMKHEVNASKSEPNTSSKNNTLDCSNMSNDIESAGASRSLAVNDQVGIDRGK